ncbi:nickel pincer cofactor biosynthesis protein LarC [Candidatus Kuenenia sp.]|uniref:nickel pincer cofactor biosynthesis protein LarC n=1 Tax=Candidatus Kuenenia sp. TaxID=2499824 RepID=UPI00321FB370
MKIAYFDCFSGVSGDMILGAFVDAGLDIHLLRTELEKLHLHGYELACEKVKRAGIAGTKVYVNIPERHEHSHTAGHTHHLTFPDIRLIIENSRLHQQIKDNGVKIFHRLATVEAEIHGTSIEDVHFHEVGAVDSIVDIVGSAIGLHLLGIEKLYFSPVPTGSGYVKCEHGVLPVPAPATAGLLKNQLLKSVAIEKELTTPTGAAIITTLGEGLKTMPEMKVLTIGYGAGSNDNPEVPNLLRIVIGEDTQRQESDEVWVVETNIDDMPGEILGYVMDKLFSAGAVDAHFTTVQMKKGRPGIIISAIVPEKHLLSVEAVLFNQTTTFGIRKYKVVRSILSREVKEYESSLGKIRMKIGSLNGDIKNISPEYEDCKRIAEERHIPLKHVYSIINKELDAFNHF